MLKVERRKFESKTRKKRNRLSAVTLRCMVRFTYFKYTDHGGSISGLAVHRVADFLVYNFVC